MEQSEIRKIFYRDGYRLAREHLEQELSAPGLKSAIGELYRAVDGLLESFLERSAAEGVPAGCKKGCAWCCHQEVFAVTHEFLYLKDHILHQFQTNEQEGIFERAREKVKLTLNRPVKEQLKIRYACPLLKDGSCMAYEARPMACRIYLSSSAGSCRREFDRPEDQNRFPELYEFPLLAGRMLNEGFVAFLKVLGLRTSELPLEQGYASMITMGQTMEEWVEGSRASS